MVIVEENHSYSGTGGIIGNSMTPYINTLAQTYLSATNLYGVTHGSPSDYKAMLAGTTAGSITSPFPNTTLVDELASAGISWKAYMESMPSDCDTSNYPPGSNSSTALYASDHNPFLYYASTRTPSACQNNVPYSQFATDLNANALPDFMFVAPNQCNDMHSECPAGGNNEPGNGDAWLKNNLPAVMASTWYQQGGIVIITWDEAYHTDNSGWVNGVACPSSSNCGGGHVPTIIVSATNKALSNHSFTTGGNLYGILRGIEEKYGVGLLASTAKAGNGDLFGALG
jgi:phospholipase C